MTGRQSAAGNGTFVRLFLNVVAAGALQGRGFAAGHVWKERMIAFGNFHAFRDALCPWSSGLLSNGTLTLISYLSPVPAVARVTQDINSQIAYLPNRPRPCVALVGGSPGQSKDSAMRRFLIPVVCLTGLAGCVVPPQGVRVQSIHPSPVVVRGPDPNCQRQRQEAQVAQRVANREIQEARTYGGRREARDAERAQAEANQERAQAMRACE